MSSRPPVARYERESVEVDDVQYNRLNKDFDRARQLFDHLIHDPLYRPSNLLMGGIAGIFHYRGQSNAEWPLLPSVFRPGNALKDFAPQPAGCPEVRVLDPNFHCDSFIAEHTFSELRACSLFLDHAEQLGMPTPLDYALNRLHFEEIFDALNRREVEWKDAFPDARLLPWLARSQHHGIPTRLLDFTSSPLHAMFFAAFDASTFRGDEKRKSERIAVYCLNRMHLHRIPDVSMVKAKGSIDSFLRAQQGVFVLHTRANKYFADNKKWPSLHDIKHEDHSLATQIHRLTIPASAADELLRILHHIGISQQNVFPSLAASARQLPYLRSLFD